jgi:hypothetical protein
MQTPKFLSIPIVAMLMPAAIGCLNFNTRWQKGRGGWSNKCLRPITGRFPVGRALSNLCRYHAAAADLEWTPGFGGDHPKPVYPRAHTVG